MKLKPEKFALIVNELSTEIVRMLDEDLNDEFADNDEKLALMTSTAVWISVGVVEKVIKSKTNYSLKSDDVSAATDQIMDFFKDLILKGCVNAKIRQ